MEIKRTDEEWRSFNDWGKYSDVKIAPSANCQVYGYRSDREIYMVMYSRSPFDRSSLRAHVVNFSMLPAYLFVCVLKPARAAVSIFASIVLFLFAVITRTAI